MAAEAVASTRPEDHLKLAWAVANKWRHRIAPEIADLDDLYATACLGLVKASRGFDPSKGRWSTYAGRCMDNEVLMAYRRSKRHVGLLRLDDPLAADGEETHADMLADPLAVVSSERVEREDDRALVRCALAGIAPRQRDAVVMVLGEGATLSDAGRRMGCHRNYVNRLVRKGLDSMRKAIERGDLDMSNRGGWNALPIDKAAVRRWIGEGLDREEIAGRLRVTPKQLVAWCHNHHVPLPPMAGEAATATPPARALVDVTIKADASETRVTPSAPEAPAEPEGDTAEATSREEWTSPPAAIAQEQYAPAALAVAGVARRVLQDMEPPPVDAPAVGSPFRKRDREGGIVIPVTVEGSQVVVGDPEVEGDITDVEVAVAAREIRQRLAALSGEGGVA